MDTLDRLWREALALPEPSSPHVWLHGDLKPTNLLVKAGKLHAVVDFGCLSVGHPDAEHSTVWDLPEHSTVWDLPEPARQAYRDRMSLDEPTWTRARAWPSPWASAASPLTGTPIPASSPSARPGSEPSSPTPAGKRRRHGFSVSSASRASTSASSARNRRA